MPQAVEWLASSRVTLNSPFADRFRARIAEDERTFAYAERTMGYYDACIRGFQAARSRRFDEARRQYARAQQFARLLREDTTSASLSSTHANAANALEASGAKGALDRLARLLEQGPAR